jgi:DnaJ-class molecular chaperone
MFLSSDLEVAQVAPGVGEIVCPECGGEPEEYAIRFPAEFGITTCVDCKGTGRVLVSM